MQDYLALLRTRREFRFLWIAQVISLLGDWFNAIATVIIVSRYTDSGLAVGWLFIARALPPFLLGPVAGVVADKFDRKQVLIASDIVRAVIVLGFLLVRDESMVWLVYALTVLQFSLSAFFEPARNAILPNLIHQDELLVANTLASSTWSAMLAFGAAIGGIAAGLFGTDMALVLDAGTFLLSAWFVTRITVNTKAIPDETVHVQGGWADMRDGFRYVMDRPRVGVVTLVKGLSQIGTADIMIALYAERIFSIGKDGAIALGLMYASFGVGAVIGPIWSNRLGNGSAEFLQKFILWGFIIMGLGWLVVGLSPIFALVCLGLILRGMGGSINWVYSSVLIQMKVPNNYMGRVFALDFSIFTLMMAIAVWLTGFLIDTLHIEPRTMSIYMAIGYILPTLLWQYFIKSPRYAPAEAVPALALDAQD